jgi:hypothetical protein
VVTVIGDVVVRVHGFPCRASGNNYLAEMAALLAALQAVPSDVEVIVHTDCLSGIFSANNCSFETMPCPRDGESFVLHGLF